jgi:hypothetical protein
LDGELDAFCALFHSLARQIPKETTLACVIDGIKYYERDIYAHEMGTVVVRLLDLLQDPYLATVVKLLVTSPLETKIVGHLPDVSCLCRLLRQNHVLALFHWNESSVACFATAK